ncbi:S-adenosyl-L-methionine-dependent methyltransferase [Mycena pura]|uniref:S-adenosyl-L-methionine-dependent methyltransferase n=1 Tax=Mycena pura TaxID=153505 RepID=A0AAD7E348_9AGAR|nr:S-adenosyl-L-methionine-dependent methyltransferase [Mycena pura]
MTEKLPVSDTSYQGGYILKPACEIPEELQRLDEIHAAISRYFGGQLCLAPMAATSPSKILDLGCGSGAWAIQAATQFPEAEVHALDISPLPDRILPSNIHFHLADLSQELNFEPETFDIVHSRFVMCHVLNGKEVIERVARLVRPGGLLLMEDMDISNLVTTGGPAVAQVVSILMQLMRARGGDGEIGRKLEAIISSLRFFEDVHVTRITAPFSGTGPNAANNELGLAIKKSHASGDAVATLFVEQDVTTDTMEQYWKELGQSGCEAIIYFTWARRIER